MFKNNNQNNFENAGEIFYGDRRRKEEKEKQERNLLLSELGKNLTPAQILYSSNEDLKKMKKEQQADKGFVAQNNYNPKDLESFAPRHKGLTTGFALSATNETQGNSQDKIISSNPSSPDTPIKKAKLLDKIPVENKTQTPNKNINNTTNKPRTTDSKATNQTQTISTPPFHEPNHMPAHDYTLKGYVNIDRQFEEPAVNHTQNKGDEKILQNIDSISKKNTGKEAWEQDENFVRELEHILGVEGGFADDPDDKRTNYGITQDTYNWYNEKHGIPIKDVKDITQREVAKIYYEDYWKASGADKIDDKYIRRMHMDTAVNHGVGKAKSLYSKAGNNFNNYKKVRMDDYDDIIKRKPEKQKFYKSWTNRVNKIEREKNKELGL